MKLDKENLRFITKSELDEVLQLQNIWGYIEWKKHTSWELSRCYGLEEERQSKFRQFA